MDSWRLRPVVHALHVDAVAPRPEAQRYRLLRAGPEATRNRLHQRLHRAGLFARHKPLRDHAEHREH